MKRALSLLLCLTSGFVCLSCGNSSTSTAPRVTSRAFVSQDVTAGNVAAGLQVIDADRDTHVIQSPITAGATPGMMVVTPNRTATLVFSPTGNNLALVSNSQESAAANVTLPGATESFVVSPDSQTAYVAVPTGPVVGQSPGEIEIISLTTGNVTAQISCPPAISDPNAPVCVLAPANSGTTLNLPYRHLAIGNSGNRLLAFSDNSNLVAVITPANIGTKKPVFTFVDGFDRPLSAFFTSDDSTAYIVNCGVECGGTQASVQTLDLTQDLPVAGTAAAVPAGTVALVSGATMYLAGTPAGGLACTQGQTATLCGQLTVFDLTTMSVVATNPDPLLISDGYHTRMAMGANGQLFIGSRTCTQIAGGSDARGCLSIYNTQGGTAPVNAPTNGDVTGLQPIAKRTVVYVVQGGELKIYDTTTDKLLPDNKQIDISGEAVDVKTVDF